MKKITILFFLLVSVTSINAQKKNYYDEWPTKETNVVGGDEIITPFYELIGREWNHKVITFSFNNGTNDIVGNGERNAIRDGFDLWATETDLVFIEICDSSISDIRISWGTFNHGDPNPPCYQGLGDFDGVNGTLAHNMGGPAPNDCGNQAAEIHFDDSENWTLNIRNDNLQPIDLVTVAAHEIGHALGLFHTEVAGSLMLAAYDGSHRFLGGDDSAGIKSIYGASEEENVIAGSSQICNTQDFVLQGLPSNLVVDWEVAPTGIVNLSGNGNTATLTPTGTGEITLTATISSSCDSIEVSKTIWAGKPDHTQFRVYQDPYCHNSNIAFGAYYGSSFDSCSLLDMGVTDIEWEVISSYGTQVSKNIGPGVCSTTNNNSGIQVYFSNTTDPQFVRFRAKNDCGWSDWLQQPLYVNFQACNPWGMVVSPNPADTYFEVTFEDTNSIKNNEIKTDFIGTIYNQNGVRLRNSRSKNGILRMNTSGLSEGIYFLHVQRGAEVIKKQIIVSH